MPSLLRFSTIGIFAASLSCSSGDGGNGPEGTIQISVTPGALTLGQGQSGSVTLTLTRGGGFAGSVSVAVQGLPSGISTSVTPSQLTGTATTATVTVNVAASVAPGSYTATVRASAAGVGEATTTYQVTVTLPPDFSLSVNPTALVINAGSNQTATVTITRNNFTGAVTLSLDSPPSGITASFDPAAPTGNTSTMTVNIGASVAPGNYTISVKGSSPSVSMTGAAVANAFGDRFATVMLTVNPAPDFSIALNPAQVSASPGGSANTNGTITRTNFTSSIAFDLASPPSGITGAFNPTSTTGGTFALTINVAASVTPGTYNVSVRGTSGTTVRTAQLQVTVSQQAMVTLSLNPAQLPIQAGGNATTTLTATRVNFTGTITLSSSGEPGGMTVGFNPTSLTGVTSTVTVTVGSGVAAGNYNLTISGATTGAGTPTVNLQVTVTAPAGTQATWTFADPNEVPVWFGVKDGNGPWTQVTGVTQGTVTTFSFNIASATASVALVQGGGAGLLSTNRRIARALRIPESAVAAMRTSGARQLGVRGLAALDVTDAVFSTFEYRGTAQQTRDLGDQYNVPPTTWGLLDISSSGVPPADVVRLACGGYSADIFSNTTTTGLTAEPGIWDCLALRSPLSQNDWFFGNLYRGITVPGTFSENNWTSHAPVGRPPVSIGGGPPGALYTISEGLETSRGLTGTFILQQALTSSPSRTGFSVPGTQSTDNHYYAAFALAGDMSVQQLATRIQYFGSTMPPATLPMPADVAPYTVTEAVGGPGENLFGITVTPLTGSEISASVGFTGSPLGVGAGNAYSIIATKEWMAVHGNTLAMESKAAAGFPGSAYLGLPRQASVVLRTATNITGPGNPAGSFFTIAARTQIP